MRRSQQPSHPARGGFTLVELLVVIFIIAVLMSLTLAAVMKVRDTGPRMVCRSDISKLEASIAAFNTDFGVDYIPSKIVLREDGLWGTHADAGVRELEIASRDYYLKKLWPRLAVATPVTPLPPGRWHDWNGDGVFTAGDAGAFVLEGDQCLVFFLGGIPTGAPPTMAVTGFSSNREYPATPGGSRKGPFFVFESSRLRLIPGASPLVRTSFFPSYVDGYDRMPYAYFSARSFGSYQFLPPLTRYRGYANTDCATLGVLHYVDTNTPPRPFGRDTYQIICAGRDMTFGTTGSFNAAAGLDPSTPGADDLASFHPAMLGAGTQ